MALRSIYEGQTRKPDEIVVVFDGPLTEGLYQVLEAFASEKGELVRYCPLKEHRGLGEALKAGTKYCTGEYIFRMDADDISDGTRFEKQLAYMTLHPEIDVLGTDIAEFRHSLKEEIRLRRCPADHEGIVKMGKRRNPMNHVSVCIKRASLEACGGYEPLLLLEDYYLWIRMISAGFRFANLQEALVFVRVGGDFALRRGARARISGWRVLQGFMLRHHMLHWWQALWNMVCVTVFVCTPGKVKQWLYQHFLRVQIPAER